MLLNMQAYSKVYGECTKWSENLKYIFTKNDYLILCIISSVLLLFQKSNFLYKLHNRKRKYKTVKRNKSTIRTLKMKNIVLTYCTYICLIPKYSNPTLYSKFSSSLVNQKHIIDFNIV